MSRFRSFYLTARLRSHPSRARRRIPDLRSRGLCALLLSRSCMLCWDLDLSLESRTTSGTATRVAYIMRESISFIPPLHPRFSHPTRHAHILSDPRSVPISTHVLYQPATLIANGTAASTTTFTHFSLLSRGPLSHARLPHSAFILSINLSSRHAAHQQVPSHARRSLGLCSRDQSSPWSQEPIPQNASR